MDMGKDLTPSQARKWVAQELAKHSTPASKARRIATETAFLAELKAMGLDRTFPNSMKAHAALIAALHA